MCEHAQHGGRGGVFPRMSNLPSIDAILSHQDFVLRLARGLTADRTTAEDLAQEAWLQYLRRPPRAAAAIGSWLTQVVRNGARNRARDGVRRAQREQAVARPEAVHADDPHERLELQQRVVTAVLQLDEPYRRTLLLYYYDGLSAAAIAAQTGVPAGTVRSRITRALDQLRHDLDAQRPGGRAAWLPGLIAFADRGRAAGIGIWLLAGGGVAAAALTGVLLLLRNDAAPPLANAAVQAAVSAAPAEVAVGGAPRAATVAAQDPAPAPVRAEVAGAATAPTTRPLAELEAEAGWLQHLLRQRLLVEPAAAALRDPAAVGDGPDAGTVRLLRRELAEFAWSTALGVRGGGAYYSFATRSHAYDDHPDVALDNDQFASGFHGGVVGLVLPLGDTPLAALGDRPPTTLATERLAAWDHMWRATPARPEDAAAFRQRAEQLAIADREPARPGHTYLLRRTGQNEHDVLVAFRSLGHDEHGHTLAFRVLRTFTPSARVASGMPAAPAGEPPAELAALPANALLARLADLRATAEPQLLTVPRDVLVAHANELTRADAGACRILARGRFAAVVQSREGAAYFDFVDRTHAFGAGVHVGLEQGRLSTGGDGFVLDLGPVPLAAAAAGLAGDAALRERADFVRRVVPLRGERGARSIADADAERARTLDLRADATAVAGHTYLLRSVQHEHMLLVAFTVVQLDRDGATLVFRILARDGR
jgi:RNA polymerase sigma-70 factor (ECF subfamily)